MTPLHGPVLVVSTALIVAWALVVLVRLLKQPVCDLRDKIAESAERHRQDRDRRKAVIAAARAAEQEAA